MVKLLSNPVLVVLPVDVGIGTHSSQDDSSAKEAVCGEERIRCGEGERGMYNKQAK